MPPRRVAGYAYPHGAPQGAAATAWDERRARDEGGAGRRATRDHRSAQDSGGGDGDMHIRMGGAGSGGYDSSRAGRTVGRSTKVTPPPRRSGKSDRLYGTKAGGSRASSGGRVWCAAARRMRRDARTRDTRGRAQETLAAAPAEFITLDERKGGGGAHRKE